MDERRPDDSTSGRRAHHMCMVEWVALADTVHSCSFFVGAQVATKPGSIQFAFVAETRMDAFIDGLVFIVEDLWSAQVRQAVIENATRQARIWAASLKYPPFLWPISDRENTAVAISSLRNFGQLSGCLTGRAETDCDPYCISRSRVLSSTRRLLPRRTKPNQQAKNHHSLQYSSDESYPSTDGVGAFPHRIYTFPVVGKM